MLQKLTEKVINNKKIAKADMPVLLSADTEELCAAANKIKEHFCQNRIDLCSIINGKSGACTENCKFCAQGSACKEPGETYGFVPEEEMIEDCRKHRDAGVHRYSIVTAGRTLSQNDLEKAARAYTKMREQCKGIELCGSHGLLTYEQLLKLKESGITRYHCNIETSPSYFDKICTTHTFADKIKTIKAAQKAGLEICSGGIIGMGESMDDRIEMAFVLSELEVKSIPINILMPIKGTQLENACPLTADEILRTIAIFRFIVPQADIRIAAGRKYVGLKAFYCGANATITGDMLTTTGSTIAEDMKMFKENGFTV